MIEYKISDRIIPNELDCFFQDWKSPPSIKIKGKLLDGADLIITARENGKTALTQIFTLQKLLLCWKYYMKCLLWGKENE